MSRRLLRDASSPASITVGDWAIDLAQLQRAVSFVNPSAVLVPSRILRRVIKRQRGLWFLGGRNSRRSEFTIEGEALSAIVDRSEIDQSADLPWPKTAILLAQPHDEEFATIEPERLLTRVWRQLFRAGVRQEMKLALHLERKETDADLIANIHASIGDTELAEARSILINDGLILGDDSEETCVIEFVAQFFDLVHFAPSLLAHSFPAIENPSRVEAIPVKNLNVSSMLSVTRPPGAVLLSDSQMWESAGPLPDQSADDPTIALDEGSLIDEPGNEGPGLEDARSVKLSRRAELVASRGNHVRAAIMHSRASKLASPHSQEEERAKARGALKQLTSRLQKALFIRKGESELWAEALAPLLRRASRGFWSPEARMLYDLQKVCLDHEREIYRLDTMGWLLSFGKRPLRHPLPHLREVTTSNHLRSAARRLPRAALTKEDRARLDLLLRPAVHRAEDALRERFRPWLDSTLETTWVRPKNLPERVAYRKLVEELLDQIVAKGFMNLGDLRDAASRSNLKMPDLAGPGEFHHGDRLLDADFALAESLDGVHRRGEIYLRTLQRFSALAFGTRTGRFVTLYIALPFGGAYMALMGVQEILELISRHVYEFHVDLNPRWNALPLGMIALAAINVRRFRSEVFAVLSAAGRVLHATFVTLPSWVLRNPLLQKFFTSRPVTALWRVVGKPLMLAVPAWSLANLAGMRRFDAAAISLFVLIASCLVFNTRAGRRVEELASEAVVESWREFAGSLIPGLFRVVLEIFERLLEWVEKLIYAVDEWLRFREGQSRFSLASKAVIGLAWGVVAYLVRFYVNLLIEPQVNPIKHFPVVTVSHKMMLPFLGPLTGWLSGRLEPIFGLWTAEMPAWSNVFLLPGFFGFLAWELKSNWRLYEANRPKQLEPVIVGSHGETVARLLRPGFHSGTLPKQFAALRRAEGSGRRDQTVVKRRAALHHVEESLSRFVERDLVALLHESRELGEASIRVGSVRLATNRIRLDLVAGADDQAPLRLEIVEQGGVLSAAIFQAGWSRGLEYDARQTLNDAIVGFLKMSGVDVVTSSTNDPGPMIALERVVVTWEAWLKDWEREVSGEPSEPLVAGLPVLPGLEEDSGEVTNRPGVDYLDRHRIS